MGRCKVVSDREKRSGDMAGAGSSGSGHRNKGACSTTRGRELQTVRLESKWIAQDGRCILFLRPPAVL